MTPRLVALTLVVLAACPALAQKGADPLRDVLRDGGQRLPGRDGEPETDFAELLSAALDLDLESIERLEQPDEHRPFAGERVSGEGQRLRYKNLSVVRLKFGSPSAARAYAGAVVGSVDAGDPTIVTAALGKDANPSVVAEAEAQARGMGFSKDLSLLLGRKELSRGDYTGAVVVPKNRRGFHGVSLRFRNGLLVLRLEFSSGADARSVLETCIDPHTPARLVCDQRGTQLLLLRGAKLDDVEFATRALGAGWRGWQRARRKRETIAVCAPSRRDTPNFVAYTLTNGKLYQAGAATLRRARKRTRKSKVEGKSGGMSWRFLDPKTRNHLVFWTSGTYGGAVARPGSMFVAINPGKDACKAERKYFADLLRGIGYKLPRKPTAGKTPLLAPLGK